MITKVATFIEKLFNTCCDDEQKHFQLKTLSRHNMNRLPQELFSKKDTSKPDPEWILGNLCTI